MGTLRRSGNQGVEMSEHQPLTAYQLDSWVCVVLTHRSFLKRGQPGYGLLEREEAVQLRDSLNALLDGNDVDDLV